MSPSEETQAALALRLAKDVGPVMFKKIIEVFKRPSKALKASKREWARLKGVGGINFEADIASGRLREEAKKEAKKASDAGATIVGYFDETYPGILREIYDPPIVLFVKGKLPDLEAGPAVAVVGSRTPSLYGRRMARTIARDLAGAGVVVVSGMAVGVDTAAHEGALDAAGVTVAVLGGGLSRIYPSENKGLADKICMRGALLSEYPMEMSARAEYFPVRNRLISGLSQAALVVEAKEKSGALITADSALEQGRDVFALPGNADSAWSVGTNRLLKQGAKVAITADDILDDLRWTGAPRLPKDSASAEPAPNLNADEQQLWNLVGEAPMAVDLLIEQSGLKPQRVMSALSCLEVKGVIQQLPGKRFIRK